MSAVSTLVAAIAAIAIPVVLYRWSKLQSKQSEKREIETRTLNEMNILNRQANRVVTEIMKRSNGPQDLTYEKISGNAELEGFVFELLNQYNYVCLGANKGIFASHIILDLRGNALKRTREQYDGYIKEYRVQYDKEAWIEIDNFLSASQ